MPPPFETPVAYTRLGSAHVRAPSRESPVYDSIHGPLPPAPCSATTSGSRRPTADGGTWTRAERSRPELVRVIVALPGRCRPHFEPPGGSGSVVEAVAT